MLFKQFHFTISTFCRQRRTVSVPRLQRHLHILGAGQVHQSHHLFHPDRGDRGFHSGYQRRDRFFAGGYFCGYFILGVRVVKQHFHLPDAPGSRQRQIDVVVLQQYECDDPLRAADLHVRVPGTYYLLHFFCALFLLFSFFLFHSLEVNVKFISSH